MALTVDDLLTREEIRDALTAYSHGLDQRNWDIYARAWTEDATIVGPGAGVPEPIHWRAWQERLQSANDATRLSGQHLLNNTWFEIDGDRAHTVTEFTWRTLQTLDKPDMVYEIFGGGLYVDDLERTADGWRIAARTLAVKSTTTSGLPYPPERIDAIRHTLTTNWYQR
jgi:3-phenylpropionate/cinnamic acid dioxygenase small subunit